MDKLQELEKKYKELGEEIERLKNEKKVWKPEKGEEYWLITDHGNHYNDIWDGYSVENRRYDVGNCFKTKAEAEAMVEKIKIYTELKRLAEEINTEPIDWKNRKQWKYTLAYDFEKRKLIVDSWQYTQTAGSIYSTSKDFLKIAKERIGEDRLLKLFKEN